VRLAGSGYIVLREGVDLLKVDFQGNVEWSRHHDIRDSFNTNERVVDLVVAKDGGSYVLVIYSSNIKGGYSSRFACYDVDGVYLWHKWLDSRVCVEVVLPCEADGSYYVGGSQEQQIWFAKLDSTGEVVWSRTYGAVSSKPYIPWPCVCSVVPTLDGGFLFGGVDPSSERGVVVRVDGEGLVQWSSKFGEPVYEVVEVREGQFLVFSFSKIICLSPSGKMLWSEPYFKYAGVESVTIGNRVRSPVSVFVGGDGDSLVVAIPYSVLGYYTSCLWVAEFTVEPISVSFLFGGVGLLFGCLVVAVVVLVFVGYWFYFKKGRKFFVG